MVSLSEDLAPDNLASARSEFLIMLSMPLARAEVGRTRLATVNGTGRILVMTELRSDYRATIVSD